jgi:hypothetical protein
MAPRTRDVEEDPREPSIRTWLVAADEFEGDDQRFVAPPALGN